MRAVSLGEWGHREEVTPDSIRGNKAIQAAGGPGTSVHCAGRDTDASLCFLPP